MRGSEGGGEGRGGEGRGGEGRGGEGRGGEGRGGDTYPLIHDTSTLGHLDGVDVPPGTLHPQHLTVYQSNQHLTHLTLYTCSNTNKQTNTADSGHASPHSTHRIHIGCPNPLLQELPLLPNDPVFFLYVCACTCASCDIRANIHTNKQC